MNMIHNLLETIVNFGICFVIVDLIGYLIFYHLFYFTTTIKIIWIFRMKGEDDYKTVVTLRVQDMVSHMEMDLGN